MEKSAHFIPGSSGVGPASGFIKRVQTTVKPPIQLGVGYHHGNTEVSL